MQAHDQVADPAAFLGYGFDIYGKMDLASGLKMSVVSPAGNVSTSTPTAPFTYASSGYESRTEVEDAFKAQVGVKYDGIAFSGEFDSCYSSSSRDSSDAVYGLCDIVVPASIANLTNSGQGYWSSDFTTDSDVASLPVTYDESTRQQFFRVFQRFGTHVVTQVTLGGHLRATSLSLATSTMSKQDASASARFEFDALFSDVSGSASSDWSKVDKSWFSSRAFYVDVLGGDPSTVPTGHAYGDSDQGKVSDWISSVPATPGVAAFALTPISEVFSGPLQGAVAQALDAYLNGVIRFQIAGSPGNSFAVVGRERFDAPAFENPPQQALGTSHWVWVLLLDSAEDVTSPSVQLNKCWNLEVAGGVSGLLDAAIRPVAEAHENLTVLVGGVLVNSPDAKAPYPALEQLAGFNGFDLARAPSNSRICYVGSSSQEDPYAATNDPAGPGEIGIYPGPLSNTVNVNCQPVEIIDQQGPVVL